MKISLCMIVWNEEQILPRALKGVGALADEIVIVDTGSTDDTINVARQLGANVIVGADRMHKGNARNLAQEHATGDWIVVLDADEWIKDPKALREHIESTDAQALFVRVGYVDDNDDYTLSWHQLRCWKRDAFKYKYRAHEAPEPVNGWGKTETTEIQFAERAVADRTWKVQYTLDRLLLDVEENPGDARPVYYLGRQYNYAGEWEKAIEYLSQYIELAPDGRDVADAWSHIASCYKRLGNTGKQKESLYLACCAQPNRREFWGNLASIYRAEGNQSLAAGLLKCALEIPKPTGLTYTSGAWHGSHIYDTLARCLWKLKRYHEGKEYAQIAVDLSPDSERLKRNLLFFEDATQEKKRLVLKPSDKKLLFLTLWDNAGVAYKYAQAVNELNGCAARSVVYHSDYTQYPKDVFQPTIEELDELFNWCDIIYLFDDVLRDGLPDKEVRAIYTGSTYRNNFKACNSRDNGIKQFCTTIDLEQHGPEWLPVPMARMVFDDVVKNDEFTVVHAPTVRSRKGTEFVEKLQGVKVDIIENVTNAECLRRKAAGHVLVDQFELGYGVNALEAWALGLPVVASADNSILLRIEERIGYLPFIESDPVSLQGWIEDLSDYGELYNKVRDIGVKYLEQFHNPKKVAEKLVSENKITRPTFNYHGLFFPTGKDRPFLRFMDYLILALATWRLTSLLVNEDGPFDIFFRFRSWSGVQENEYGRFGTNVVSNALTCFWCSSIWVAVGVYLWYILLPFEILIPFALSAAAIIVSELND